MDRLRLEFLVFFVELDHPSRERRDDLLNSCGGQVVVKILAVGPDVGVDFGAELVFLEQVDIDLENGVSLVMQTSVRGGGCIFPADDHAKA